MKIDKGLMLGVLGLLTAGALSAQYATDEVAAWRELARELDHETALVGQIAGPRSAGRLSAPQSLLPSAAANDSYVSASAAATATVSVDCAAGEKIKKALKTDAKQLVVEVSGICHENVEITRDRVTLRGSDPLLDGIRPRGSNDPRQSALRIRESRRIVVENLSLRDSMHDGLRVLGSTDGIEVNNCRFENNGVRGITLIDSVARINNAVVTGNGFADLGSDGGVLSFGSSVLVCTECDIFDNPSATAEAAARAANGGSISFEASHLAGNFGAIATQNSRISITGGSLEGGNFAAAAVDGGRVILNDISYNGSLLGLGGNLEARGAFQASASVNIFSDSSTVQLSALDGTAATASSLSAPTVLETFSNLAARQHTALDSLQCSEFSQAVCSPDVVPASSSCGGCPTAP